MTAKDYRPWERPRLIGRCASCGENHMLTGNGLCAYCEQQYNRGHQAAAPAFQPATSERTAARPDGRLLSFGSRPTIESAGSARFCGGSRDTW